MYIEEVRKYDDKLLKGRIETESAVLGCIFGDMGILKDFKLKEEYFVTKDGKFLFKLAEGLDKRGITDFTDFDLINNFNEKVADRFDEIGGFTLIEHMKNNISTNNASSYIDDLYKSNAILKLSDAGFCLTDKILWQGKEIIPLELFEKYDSQQVRDFYDNFINDINVLEYERGIEETEIEISDDFLQSCYEGEKLGTLFDLAGFDEKGEEIRAFPRLSDETGGLLTGTLSMLAGYSSVGKSTILISIIMALVYRGEKVCIISNEQKASPFIMNFLMWILTRKLGYYNITKKKLLIGEHRLSDEDKVMLKRAQDIFNKDYKGNIFFVSIPDANMGLVKQKFRQYCIKKGCGVFIYDTFKIDFNGKNDNFWLSLIEDSRELDTLAKKYDAIALATIQCANNTLGQLFLDSNVLSNSKQIKEILENLYIVRDVYEEEKDPKSQYYCNPYWRVKDNNGKWKNQTIELERDKSYKMLFIDKVRSGSNSTSGNYAIILKFDGAYGTVKELCLCKPQRKRIGN